MSIYGIGLEIEINRIRRKLSLSLLNNYSCNAYKKLLEVFSNSDRNNDNTLNKEELEIGLKELGCILTKIEFNHFFNYFDKDKSGSLDFNEFFEGFIKPLENERFEKIKFIFDYINSENKTDFEKFYNFENKSKFNVIEFLNEKIDFKNFLRVHSFLSSTISVDSYFYEGLDDIWNIKTNKISNKNLESIKEIKSKFSKIPNIINYIDFYDINNNGYLDKNEFTNFVKDLNLNRNEINILKESIIDDNGKIYKNEIKNLLIE